MAELMALIGSPQLLDFVASLDRIIVK